MISEKKKKGHHANLVYVCLSSLLISKKKKGYLAKLFYVSPSFLSIYKKKAIILKLPQGEGEFG